MQTPVHVILEQSKQTLALDLIKAMFTRLETDPLAHIDTLINIIQSQRPSALHYSISQLQCSDTHAQTETDTSSFTEPLALRMRHNTSLRLGFASAGSLQNICDVGSCPVSHMKRKSFNQADEKLWLITMDLLKRRFRIRSLWSFLQLYFRYECCFVQLGATDL